MTDQGTWHRSRERRRVQAVPSLETRSLSLEILGGTQPSTPEAKRPLMYLPAELLLAIAELLADRHEFRSLANFARASRASRTLVVPVLYRTVILLRGRRALAFHRTVISRAEFGPLVRTLAWPKTADACSASATASRP